MQKQNLPKNKTSKPSTTFAERVYAVVRKIPNGKTLTYMEVAEKAGFAKAYRAVGSLMSNNFDPDIPCHRVIKSDGTVGGYNRGGSKNKTKILKNERKQNEKKKYTKNK